MRGPITLILFVVYLTGVVFYSLGADVVQGLWEAFRPAEFPIMFAGGELAMVVFLVLAAVLAWMSIKIVPEYKRIVVFRLGRAIGEKGPGLVWLWPFIDRGVWVDLREIFLEIPEQTCITQDNASIAIDFLIYFKVVQPSTSVINVVNFAGATQGIAITTLRAVVGDISLDDVLAKREQINQTLRAKLDEVTVRWGGKVTSVEIREIKPPAEVEVAMTKQMAAERNRRAMVTEADGTRSKDIKVAEGEKQAAILKAEGDRQAAILRAEGYALALQKISEIARTIDPKTMNLQYLETLKTLGEGAATKFIFPAEFTNLLKPFIGYAAQGTKE